MENNLVPDQDDNELPFYFRQNYVSEEKRLQNWDSIENAIAGRTRFSRKKRNILISFSTVIALGIGLMWFFNTRESLPLVTEYITGYGQLKIIVLPDSSKLVLNAHSSIKIPQHWNNEGDRQVWLEGEAYFEVEKKMAAPQKFIVHTAQVDVEVLGTKFNVNTRRSESIVALEEGKVQLFIKEKGIKILEKKTNPSVILKPGELAKIDSTLSVHVSDESNIDHYSGWVKNEYHFDDTPLGEVSKMIEDIYGYKMIAADSTLLNRSISGDLRAANIDDFVKVLQATLNLKMNIEGKAIIITKP